MFFETQGGRKKAGNVHKDVFHGWSGAVPSDWLALRVEDVKARRALRQQKPHRAVENGFITTSRSRATASAVDWTSRDLIRGTAGWANVNKPTSNTTRRDAARKRPSVIVGGSGMMWLSTLCMIVFNVGWFSAPEPDDETHLLMNPRSQSQDSVNFGINAIPCKYTDISADKQKKQKCNNYLIMQQELPSITCIYLWKLKSGCRSFTRGEAVSVEVICRMPELIRYTHLGVDTSNI